MNSSIRVAAYTQGRQVPSARFRVRQLIPDLMRQGIVLQEYYTSCGAYPPRNKWLQPGWVLGSMIQRGIQLTGIQPGQVSLLQRELISTLPTLERLTARPRLLDVDDAIWLPRPAAIKRIVAACDGIICGNPFLADWFGQWHKPVYILPTGIDVQRFCPNVDVGRWARFQPIIVWSGSSSGFGYLHAIEPALQRVLAAWPQARLRIIADRPPHLAQLKPDQIDFLSWSPQTEVHGLQQADIGIMPLLDSDWARGKCGFKLLAYLACGLPVVASPVGMNADILALTRSSLAAGNPSQWADALIHMLTEIDQFKCLARHDRDAIARKFGTSVIAARLAAIIRKVA